MLNRICWLHSKLRHDQVIIAIQGYEVKTIIGKSDILRKDDDCLTILHPDESITVINPEHVVKIYTARKGVAYL